MRTVPRRHLRDLVTVEERLGEGAVGSVYADPVDVLGKVSMVRLLVRNSAGVEEISEATVYLDPEDAAPFVPESRVTIDGRVSRVITGGAQSRPGTSVLVKVMCS